MKDKDLLGNNILYSVDVREVEFPTASGSMPMAESPMMITNYRIIQFESIDQLNEQVIFLRRRGWHPVGRAFSFTEHDTAYICQTMVMVD